MRNYILKVFCILMLTGLVSTDGYAQIDYFDFTYKKKAVKERRAIPFRYVREADAVWSKRIERIIDTREKKNLPLKWPKNPLNKIVYSAATDGSLTAYRNDSLSSIFTPEEVLERGGSESVVQIYPDPDDPYYYIDSIVYNPYQPEKIIKFRMMEDWIFDKQSGLFFSRIIGIAPIFKPEIEGAELPEQPLFWLKWDELRDYLVNYEIFNRHNDAARLTYYDFFEMRLFSSYIVREPNEFDYSIKDFEEFKNDPFAALLESEKIKSELFQWEHDLWQY
ncbi:MAG: gliding motility protein GldN [Bacteroidia bacterium]